MFRATYHGDRKGRHVPSADHNVKLYRYVSKYAPCRFVSGQKQGECKARARPWGTFHLDAAMMRLYHLFDDSQTEAGAAGCARARGVGAIKAFKNVGQVFLRSTTG